MAECQDSKSSTTTSKANPLPQPKEQSLAHVPKHLRISIVYQDDDIIVVNKPCNLRSVPGNAEPPPPSSSSSRPTKTGKRKLRSDDDDEQYQKEHAKQTKTPKTSHDSSLSEAPNNKTDGEDTKSTTRLPPSMSPQDAWVEAIKQIAEGTESTLTDDSEDTSQEDEQLRTWIARLGGQESQRASIPRRYAAFCRYVKRSRNRIFGTTPTTTSPDDDEDKLADISTKLFRRIEVVQKQIQQLPTPTTDEESVVGQVKLLGLACSTDSRANQDLFVVHRLDCQTSGLLVLARTSTAASFLSQCWRTRDRVHKTYRALVNDWPPFRNQPCHNDNDDDTTTTTKSQNEKQTLQGEINLPMAPHPTERLKWVVVPANDDNAKPCKTLWKVLQPPNADDSVALELQPITGRTHQLRVHCAAMGGIIRGDSLYGTNKNHGDDDNNNIATNGSDFLYLHAEKLSFPHPATKEMVSFQVDPPW